MSILDRMRENAEKKKKEQTLKEGKPYDPPTWPEGFPQLLEIKPQPQEGFIEERIIYRMVLGKKQNQFINETFYVSQNEIFVYFETEGKVCEWNVLSFEEYKQEYERVYEYVKKNGKLIGRNKFSELIFFDEVVTKVPIKLIMELKPSPEEIDIGSEAHISMLESKYEKMSREDDDFLAGAEYDSKDLH